MDLSEKFRRELLDEFRESATERIEKISSSWLKLEKAPDDEDTSLELMRQLHTLKGEAKMMGFEDVGLVAHRCEELFVAGKGIRFREPRFADLFLGAVDSLNTLVTKKAGAGERSVDLSDLINRIDALLGAMGAVK